jgi:hypothetical protein
MMADGGLHTLSKSTLNVNSLGPQLRAAPIKGVVVDDARLAVFPTVSLLDTFATEVDTSSISIRKPETYRLTCLLSR